MGLLGYIFLETIVFGGRNNEACFMSILRQDLYKIREEQIRNTALEVQRLLDDYHTEDRQHGKAAADLPEMAVQPGNTERDVRGRPYLPQEDSTVLGALAPSSEGRIEKGCLICGRDLHGAKSMHTDLL